MSGLADKVTPRASSIEKQRLRVWVRWLRATQQIEAHLRERLRIEFDTTLPRFDVMAALARAPAGLTMTALSRQLLVSNGNVTGIIERLAADGQVSRALAARDRRTTIVHLTPKGAHDFAAMAAAHETWVADVLGRFTPDDVMTILDLLDRAAPVKPPETDMP